MPRKDTPPEEPKNTPQDPLPPLSPKDFRTYNRMAEQMNAHHNHFRHLWTQLQTACTTTQKRSPSYLSPKNLISTALHFCSGLHFHHSIEEEHVFPVLAKRMPEFRKELSLISQHKAIHRGVDALVEYLEKCRDGEVELERGEVKRLMDVFGGVLWEHLDEEVVALGAENMRRYWSLGEMGVLLI